MKKVALTIILLVVVIGVILVFKNNPKRDYVKVEELPTNCIEAKVGCNTCSKDSTYAWGCTEIACNDSPVICTKFDSFK